MWKLPGFSLTPPEIFEKLKEQGYDWDELLGETRGHWQFKEIKEEKHYLSSYDLIRMAMGKYKPYWKQ